MGQIHADPIEVAISYIHGKCIIEWPIQDKSKYGIVACIISFYLVKSWISDPDAGVCISKGNIFLDQGIFCVI